MKAVVIGLGSMGKRRIRLIGQFDSSIEIIGVDGMPERRQECEKIFGMTTFDSLDNAIALGKPDCAFVCTSPISHGVIISQCLNAGLHVFTEINLVDDRYDENIAMSKQKGVTLFLSSTFLYREEIRYIDNCVKTTALPLNYIYHIGQYLPDWHPWEDYTKYFVSDKRTNGCREIFAIELPWLTTLFGDVIDFTAVKSRNSTLKIDYPDNYLVTLIHTSGAKGMLAVDVVSRRAVRNFELYGEEIYLSWDGSPASLSEYDFATKTNKNIELYKTIDKQEGYSAFVIENAYLNEIVSFFAEIKNNSSPIYDFEKDKNVLQLIDRIENC